MENPLYLQLDADFLVCINVYSSADCEIPSLAHRVYFANGKADRDEFNFYSSLDFSGDEIVDHQVNLIYQIFPFAKELNQEEFDFELLNSTALKVLK